jgi:hypothetical protein
MISQPQEPRSVEFLKKQLEKLAKVQGSVNTEVPLDFGTKLTLNSLARHEADLREELKAAEWLEAPGDMELVLEGPSVVEHAVPADLLGQFLEQIQRLRLAIAETASGILRGSGRFANKLVEDNRLMVECFAPSSFAIRLSYASPSSEPTLFDNDETESPCDEQFMDLLSGETESEELSALFKSPRLRSNYQAFLDLVAKNDVTVGTRTKKWPFRVKMSPQNARNREQLIKYFLSPADEEAVAIEDILEIEGFLVMGDIKNNSFEITKNATSYQGKVSESGAAGLRQIALGSRVRAHLLVTNPQGKPGRSDYTLFDLKNCA